MKTYHSLPRRRGYALEHDSQVALFRWARLAEGQFPALALMFAIPNGGWRHITTAASLKDEGVKSGVPDVFLPCPARGFNGLFIEMKRLDAKPKSEDAKGPLSDEQIRWLSALTKQGYLAKVCYGSEAAIELITWYLNETYKIDDTPPRQKWMCRECKVPLAETAKDDLCAFCTHFPTKKKP